MRAFDPDPNIRWMFVFPHPDDELAVAGWLSRLKACEVACVWVHSNPIREAESRAALERLALAGRLAFFGATDGRLCWELDKIAERLTLEIAAFEPTRLVAPAFENGHLDHDAVNWVVTRLAGDQPVFEVPLYHPYSTWFPRVNRFSIPEGQEVLELTQAEIDLKRELLDLYPSQSIRRNMRYAEARARLGGDTLRTTERMRLQASPPGYSAPAGPPEIRRKVAATKRWGQWLEAISSS